MVRALLAGTKTQTRRIVKPQPSANLSWGGWVTCSTARKNEGKAMWGVGEHLDRAHYARCPYGKPGDRLWVRESIRRQDPAWDHLPNVASFFIADGEQTKADAWPWKSKALPSIHCPRGLSRITLEITGVRVERLQAISLSDALAEGISDRVNAAFKVGKHEWAGVAEYHALWESINGPGSWDANPWVWVVEFKRVNA